MEKAPQGIVDLIVDEPGGVPYVPELPRDTLYFSTDAYSLVG